MRTNCSETFHVTPGDLMKMWTSKLQQNNREYGQIHVNPHCHQSINTLLNGLQLIDV